MTYPRSRSGEAATEPTRNHGLGCSCASHNQLDIFQVPNTGVTWPASVRKRSATSAQQVFSLLAIQDFGLAVLLKVRCVHLWPVMNRSEARTNGSSKHSQNCRRNSPVPF